MKASRFFVLYEIPEGGSGWWVVYTHSAKQAVKNTVQTFPDAHVFTVCRGVEDASWQAEPCAECGRDMASGQLHTADCPTNADYPEGN